MKDESWYERYSWILFILIAVSGMIPAIPLLIAPLSGTGLVARFGHPVPACILADPNGSAFIAFLFRWIGTVLAGGNLLTVFIVLTAWRQGEPWAWWTMWYWPVMFVAHYLDIRRWVVEGPPTCLDGADVARSRK